MVRTFVTAVLGLVLLVPLAQAEEKTVDEQVCRTGTIKLLFASKGATILAVENTGINVKTGVTSRCNGVISIIAGKRKANGYCKSTTAKGDITLVEWTGSSGQGEGTWKFLYGTGEWKGVTGGGEFKRVTAGRPIDKGTFQFCSRITGAYVVPE